MHPAPKPGRLVLRPEPGEDAADAVRCDAIDARIRGSLDPRVQVAVVGVKSPGAQVAGLGFEPRTFRL